MDRVRNEEARRRAGIAAWGDQNSANVCPCACRKRRLIMGYKLSYTTGLLYAWSSLEMYRVFAFASADNPHCFNIRIHIRIRGCG